MDCYKDHEVAELDADRFRDQLLLYIVCLYLYLSCSEDKGYKFAQKFKWRKFIVKKFKKTSIDDIMKRILKQQRDVERTSFFISDLPELKLWALQFKESYDKGKNYYHKSNLSELMSQKFPVALNDLAYTMNAQVEFKVYWNFHSRNDLCEQLANEVKTIFLDEVDQHYIDKILHKKSTVMLTIEADNEVTGLSTIIAFAVLTTIKKGRSDVGLLVLEYLGCTEKSPNEVLPLFSFERFRGKGIGTFLVAMVQVILNVLTKGEENVILIECNEELYKFYEPMGFVPTEKGSKWFNLKDYKSYAKQSPPSEGLSTYELPYKTRINHLNRKFVNHIEQSLDNVDFSKYKKKPYLYKQVHEIFGSPVLYQAMQQETGWKSDFLFIPIGKIIQHLFQQRKASEYKNFLGLYERIVGNLIWVLEPNFEKGKKPLCQICFECCLCKKRIYEKLNVQKTVPIKPAEMCQEVKKLLKNLLNDHFCLDSESPQPKSRCKWLDEEANLTSLLNLRDKEWIHAGTEKQFQVLEKNLFEKLILMFLQVHIEMNQIVNYFSWDKYYSRSMNTEASKRPARQPRLASMVPSSVRQKLMLDEVLGKNEKKRRSRAAKELKEHPSSQMIKYRVRQWEKFLDDLVFLKHLNFISYVNSDTYPNFQRDILDVVTNKAAFVPSIQKEYFVGFPSNAKKSGTKTSESTDTPAYDLDTVGTVRFVDEKWIDKNCAAAFRLRLTNSPNRKMKIADSTRNAILNEMKELRRMHCTHVYKYTCEVTLEPKFCNAVKGKKNKSSDNSLVAMKGDIITKEWLYETAVVLNGSAQWFNEVMDPKKTNTFFELPVAAVAEKKGKTPDREPNAPELMYPQQGEGSCGVSAFASAFFFLFNKDLGSYIINQKQQYMESLSQPAPKKSRKASSMKKLIQIVESKPLKQFYVERKRQVMSWREIYKSNECYKSIQLCIVHSTAFSRDHIIAIAAGWIFDSNLTFAIPLNEKNLHWCASHGKKGVFFERFVEQVEIGMKK